jgi:hypothetical protein
MTTVGVDAAWSRPSPAALLAYAGPGAFVCRYLSWDPSKNITVPELVAWRKAGVRVVLNWEYDTHACQGGYSTGHSDATEALKQVRGLGLPVDDAHPIYFSPDDYDIQSYDRAALVAYLHACSDVLGGRMRVGHYGGYNGTLWAQQSGYVGWLWQTYAWSGGRWLTVNIRQVQNGVVVGGADVDRDLGMTDQIGAHGDGSSWVGQVEDDTKWTRTVLGKLVNDNGGWKVNAEINSALKAAQSAAADVQTVLAAVKAQAGGSVDPKAVAAGVVAGLRDAGFAAAVATELAKNPETATAFKDTLSAALDGVTVSGKLNTPGGTA